MLYKLYRISNLMFSFNIPFLPRIIMILNFFLFNSSVPYSCNIGKGTKFGHGGISVVINSDAIIGKNCLIGSCVTIGGKSKNPNVPIIGDNVYIATGAKIIGDVKIGSNVVIGANAVVIDSVPSNCVVDGVPAKIIKKNIILSDFI